MSSRSVQDELFLLGDEDQVDPVEEHTPDALFIELSEFVSEKDKLHESGEPFEHGWKETGRCERNPRRHLVETTVDLISDGGKSKKTWNTALDGVNLTSALCHFILHVGVLLDMPTEQLPMIVGSLPSTILSR